MNVKKYISCFVLTAACLLQSSSLTIYAKESWPVGPEIMAESAIVIEAETGTVLYEKNSHEQMYPASITKILTALLAIENSSFDEEVTFSYDSVFKTEGSGIGRDKDEVMTMEQCLYALMLNSANECAYAIAEHTGVTYENFVQMMNDRAKKLGCKNTHFNNPHGLTDEQHYTSSYDMALIGREAIRNDTFRKITSTTKYTIPPTNKHPNENTYLNNHHKMLLPESDYYYEYCIGGKTGYTEAAGNTLITFAERDGMTLICVVMKEKKPDHYIDTKELLDYCFSNFRLWNIAENETKYTGAALPESDLFSQSSFVDMEQNSNIVLPKSVDFAEATSEILYHNVDEEVVGTLQYSYGNRVIGQADIKITGQEVKEYPFNAKDTVSTDEKKIIKIDIRKVTWVAIGLIIIASLGVILIKFKNNSSLIRYKLFGRKRTSGGINFNNSKKRRRKK